MKKGLHGATDEARKKIKEGYNPFKKAKGCGCAGEKACPIKPEPEKKTT